MFWVTIFYAGLITYNSYFSYLYFARNNIEWGFASGGVGFLFLMLWVMTLYRKSENDT